MSEIKIGDIVKDTVTGFKGMVVCVTTWLNGCNRMGVQPNELTKEGKPKDIETFDEMQLAIVKAKKHEPARETGGPRPSVRRSNGDPKRFR